MKKIILVCLGLFLLSFQQYDEIVPTSATEIFSEASQDHLLGTDYLGRDVFELMKVGLYRTARVVLIGNGIGFGLGVLVGLLAGYVGGRLLLICRSISDIMLVVPSFIVAIVFTAAFGLNPMSAGFALGIFDIGVYMNHTSALTQKIKKSNHVMMAKLLNIPTHKIILSHIVPNLSASLTSLIANKSNQLIIRYASLTFIGLGADITKPDWGTLLYEYRIYMVDRPLLLLWPSFGILIFSVVFHIVFDTHPQVKGDNYV